MWYIADEQSKLQHVLYDEKYINYIYLSLHRFSLKLKLCIFFRIWFILASQPNDYSVDPEVTPPIFNGLTKTCPQPASVATGGRPVFDNLCFVWDNVPSLR